MTRRGKNFPQHPKLRNSSHLPPTAIVTDSSGETFMAAMWDASAVNLPESVKKKDIGEMSTLEAFCFLSQGGKSQGGTKFSEKKREPVLEIEDREQLEHELSAHVFEVYSDSEDDFEANDFDSHVKEKDPKIILSNELEDEFHDEGHKDSGRQSQSRLPKSETGKIWDPKTNVAIGSEEIGTREKDQLSLEETSKLNDRKTREEDPSKQEGKSESAFQRNENQAKTAEGLIGIPELLSLIDFSRLMKPLGETECLKLMSDIINLLDRHVKILAGIDQVFVNDKDVQTASSVLLLTMCAIEVSSQFHLPYINSDFQIEIETTENVYSALMNYIAAVQEAIFMDSQLIQRGKGSISRHNKKSQKNLNKLQSMERSQTKKWDGVTNLIGQILDVLEVTNCHLKELSLPEAYPESPEFGPKQVRDLLAQGHGKPPTNEHRSAQQKYAGSLMPDLVTMYKSGKQLYTESLNSAQNSLQKSKIALEESLQSSKSEEKEEEGENQEKETKEASNVKEISDSTSSEDPQDQNKGIEKQKKGETLVPNFSAAVQEAFRVCQARQAKQEISALHSKSQDDKAQKESSTQDSQNREIPKPQSLPAKRRKGVSAKEPSLPKKQNRPVKEPSFRNVDSEKQKEMTAEEKKREEEENAEKLAKIAANVERKKRMEEEEKEALRREAGLVSTMSEETVHATCTASRGLCGATCLHESQGFHIQGITSYIFLTCTDNCKMYFHHDCWKQVEKIHKSTHHDWKLKRGVDCLTEGCPGKIDYCALQEGPIKDPQSAQILVHREENRTAEPQVKQRHDKAKKKPQQKARDKNYHKGQDLKHKAKHTGEDENPSLLTEDSLESKKQKNEVPKPIPLIDVSALDLDALKPFEKDESNSPKKKAEKVEKQRIRQNQKQYIQPEYTVGDGVNSDEDEEFFWTDPTRPSNTPSSFFEELSQTIPSLGNLRPSSSSQPSRIPSPRTKARGEGFYGEEGEKYVSKNVANLPAHQGTEFPSLDEASLATDDREFFNYVKAVEDILKSLKAEDSTRKSEILVLEHLDIDTLVDRGLIPEVHIREMLKAFGQIEKMQLFNVLGIVAVRYKTLEQAVIAFEALNASMMGNYEIEVHYLLIFPSEMILQSRLGHDIWQKYSSSDIQLALRTAYRAESREREIAEAKRKEKLAQEKREKERIAEEKANKEALERRQAEYERQAKLRTERVERERTERERSQDLDKRRSNRISSHGGREKSVPLSEEGWDNVSQGGKSWGSRPEHPSFKDLQGGKDWSSMSASSSSLGNSLRAPPSFGKKSNAQDSLSYQPDVPSLPENLAKFQKLEIVGCNESSISLYLEEKEAFGVVPNQLVNLGFGATPTALVLYEMNSATLYGLWQIFGRQTCENQQVVVVRLVEEFPSLPEKDWCLLLEREEDADHYNYPQCLDAPRTRELLQIMWKAKHQKFDTKKEQTLPSQGIRDTLSEMNSKEESKTEEEKELLRMVEQAERDEALARKLQQELDSSPGQNRIIEDEKDAEFAWRLQAEEERAVQPSSFAQAVRHPTYKKPMSVSYHRNKSPSPDQYSSPRNNFSDFFPTEEPRPQQEEVWEEYPPEWGEVSTEKDKKIEENKDTGDSWGNGTDAWDMQDPSWEESSSSKPKPKYNPSLPANLRFENSNWNNDSVNHELAFKRPPSSNSPSIDTRIEESGSDEHDDILGMLGIEVERKSTPAKKPPEIKQMNVSKRDDTICPICEENEACYILRPCKHWGPCLICLPSTDDKSSLYPVCKVCNSKVETVIKIF